MQIFQFPASWVGFTNQKCLSQEIGSHIFECNDQENRAISPYLCSRVEP